MVDAAEMRNGFTGSAWTREKAVLPSSSAPDRSLSAVEHKVHCANNGAWIDVRERPSTMPSSRLRRMESAGLQNFLLDNLPPVPERSARTNVINIDAATGDNHPGAVVSAMDFGACGLWSCC